MPVEEDEYYNSGGASRVRVAPSAPTELFWVLHGLLKETDYAGRGLLEGESADLEADVTSFWGDGLGFDELLVLAHRSGTILDLDVTAFFDRLEQTAAAAGPDPGLASETPEDRRVLLSRLERLRLESGLRASYRRLLERTWETVTRTGWEKEGRAAVTAAAPDWEARLRAGASIWDFFKGRRLWFGRPEVTDLVETSAAQGRLVLVPGWYFGRINLIEVDGTTYLGTGLNPAAGSAAMLRHVAEHPARQFKVLADPTRLAIFLQLVNTPATITELAEMFRLRQPTVSQHVRLLREAGLLEARAGRRLGSSPARLHELLAAQEQRLLKAVEGH